MVKNVSIAIVTSPLNRVIDSVHIKIRQVRFSWGFFKIQNPGWRSDISICFTIYVFSVGLSILYDTGGNGGI